MTCATPAPLPVMPASIFASATAQSIGASIPRTGAGSLGGMGTRATSTLRHGRRASETIHIEKRERDDGYFATLEAVHEPSPGTDDFCPKQAPGAKIGRT